jgi:hypothetical protein
MGQPLFATTGRSYRELATQELGILALIKRGVRVLTANGDDLTDSSDPSRKMMRQIAGSFAEYEKARLVAKLKAARERKRLTTGKCEGRKSWAEVNPELVREAKRLRRRLPKGGQRSLRDVAAELARLGYVNERGVTFSAASVASMLARLKAAWCVRVICSSSAQSVSVTTPCSKAGSGAKSHAGYRTK